MRGLKYLFHCMHLIRRASGQQYMHISGPHHGTQIFYEMPREVEAKGHTQI
jgi:hypothetical protein